MDFRAVFILSVVMFSIVTVNCVTFEAQETKPATYVDRERREAGLFDEEFAKRGRGMRYRRCINPDTGVICKCDLFRKGPEYIHCFK